MAYKIAGIGSYLPRKVLSNNDLSKTIETSDEWIVSRTGISQRHVASEHEHTSDLALNASLEAIDSSGLAKEKIDLVIFCTTTPDLTFPSTAAILCNKLGLRNIPAFDLQAVCAGFIYGMHTAEHFIKSGNYQNILLVGAEKMSNIVDWNDRNTCILFGDGAGAVILSKDKTNFVDSVIYSDASEYEILVTDGGTGVNKQSGTVSMQGKMVFKHAVEKMPSAIKKLLDKNDIAMEDIDYFICHQANIRIIDHIQKYLNLPEEKMVKTVNLHANCSAASIPLALSELYKQNKLATGQLLAFSAIGAGLTWGACLLKW